MSDTLENRIQRVFAQLQQQRYPVAPGLNESDIASVEAALQIPLPSVTKEVLHSFNFSTKGQREPVLMERRSPIGELVFFDCVPAERWPDCTADCQNNLQWFKDLPPDDVVSVDGPVKPLVFSPHRVFFSYGKDLYWFMDFDPAAGGTVGQIVMLYPMYQENYLQIMAPDWLAFIERLASRLGR